MTQKPVYEAGRNIYGENPKNLKGFFLLYSRGFIAGTRGKMAKPPGAGESMPFWGETKGSFFKPFQFWGTFMKYSLKKKPKGFYTQ